MKTLNINNINSLPQKTAVTVGMFDGLHLGHRHLVMQLLQEAELLALEPIVVTFDRHPRQVLDPSTPMTLLSTQDERLALLEECGVPTVAMVHFDIATAALSACEFTRQFLCNRLNMHTLLLGYDNMFGSRRNNDFDLLPQVAAEKGFTISRDRAIILDGIEISSTKIRKALADGNIAFANAMLGRPYSAEGIVVHGRNVGTKLGFPTANISPSDPCKILPANGVYALRATIGGTTYAAMANLGSQPTFHQEHPVLEVHLLDFNGDLYDRPIKVEFLSRLRDIQSFASPDALAAQLQADREAARAIIDK